MGKKNKKAPKSQILFDEDERAKYLLGFRKRKQQRKQKAREELEEKIKQEKKRQKELARGSFGREKKLGLPLFGNKEEIKVVNKKVIETNDNTIIISELSSKYDNPVVDDDDENDDKNTAIIRESEVKDAELNQVKAKISKECALITERLTKLEKKKKTLEKADMSNTKKKKNLLKSKKASAKNKASRKLQQKGS